MIHKNDGDLVDIDEVNNNLALVESYKLFNFKRSIGTCIFFDYFSVCKQQVKSKISINIYASEWVFKKNSEVLFNSDNIDESIVKEYKKKFIGFLAIPRVYFSDMNICVLNFNASYSIEILNTDSYNKEVDDEFNILTPSGRFMSFNFCDGFFYSH